MPIGKVLVASSQYLTVENSNNTATNNQAFSGFLRDPKGIDLSGEKTIQALIQKFPYAQMLHAFQAKCYKEENEYDDHLSKAALYIPDRNILYDIIHNPGNFSKNIVEELPALAHQPDFNEEAIVAVDDANNEQDDTTNPQAGIIAISDPDEKEAEEYIDAEQFKITGDEITPGSVSDMDSRSNDADFQDEQAISITEENEPADETHADVPALDDQTENNFRTEPIDETEKLIIGNIAASDFFRFEEKLDDQLISQASVSNERSDELSDESEPINASALNSGQGVSKYDDDKMPFTFLWWLNKTRNEHSATYQPYVSFKLDTTQDIKKNSVEDFNQQIIENIFHLQSPLENIKAEEPTKTGKFNIRRKDERIERFIREEPQIRPPRPEKLDNENKARKSSEDSYDMVSETLAIIYIEQMLFHKAIDTYRKLSLKFPEKSTYFADQIRKLEITN